MGEGQCSRRNEILSASPFLSSFFPVKEPLWPHWMDDLEHLSWDLLFYGGLSVI